MGSRPEELWFPHFIVRKAFAVPGPSDSLLILLIFNQLDKRTDPEGT